MAEPIGELPKFARGAPVRCSSQPQMRYRIAFEAISSALQKQKFRLESRQVRDRPRPNFRKSSIGRAGRQRQVELGAGRSSAAGFVHRTRARIQIASVFVDVGNNHIGVVFESVINAVAVVGVDIHVGNALEPRAPAQELNGNPAIVEYAEARRVVARRVVQACDGHERAAAAALHDRIHCVERGANHVGGGLVNAAKGGGVACIQKSLAGRGTLAHEIDISGRMEA